jgi:hypothetical protein
MSSKRRILQPLLMILAVLTCATLVAATLRGRPAISPPKNIAGPYSSDAFQLNLARANQQIGEMSVAVDHQTAGVADNFTLARRISLALVGSGLSLEEIRALSLVPEDQQVEWITEYLLADPRWADYFAERFSRVYVGTNDGPFLLFRRRKFNAWLSQQFQSKRPYDEIVREMLSAEGLWTDTPSVNFVTATMDEANAGRGDPIRLAGRTSRAFLAQRIDCLQCHDDFLGNVDFGKPGETVEGVQEHFHALAAFFSGTSLPAPFQGIREDGKAYEYKFLGEDAQRTVDPMVPFGAELLQPDGKPRERLAAWVTHPENRAFSRAAVNRVWALMFSRPLVAPIDNIPLDDSVPPVMDTLAQDFVDHNFDLRRLIRLTIGTDAFRRASRADFEIHEEHEAAWAVFPITQLRPEQVSGSLFQACSLKAIDSTSSIFTRLKTFGDGQDFLKSFGDRGEDEFDSEAVTITQRLVLMNGNSVAERTKVDLVGNACTRIDRMVADNAKAIELVFLSVFNRLPTETEAGKMLPHLEGQKGNARSRAINDIYWAMINSTEFSWNH